MISFEIRKQKQPQTFDRGEVPLSLKIFLRETKVPSEKWQIWRGL